MVQLFSIAWGIFNVHLLLNLDNPSEKISLKDVTNFFTLSFIKVIMFTALGLFTIFEAAGYLLCYAYLDFNIAIETIFWISVAISSITILLIHIAFILECNDLNKGKDSEEENSSYDKSSLFSILMKLNLIFLIVLSALLFRFFLLH